MKGVSSRGMPRRDVLRSGAMGGLAVMGSALWPAVATAGLSTSTGKPAVVPVKATVMRWLDSDRVSALRELRAGWFAPCASPGTCPVRLNDLVDLAPVRSMTGPQQMELRLVGFDGVSPAADHGLDVLFPADGAASLVPYRLGEVRGNRMLGSSQSQIAWGWDGRVPLAIATGAGGKASTQSVDIPAVRGVYMIALADSRLQLDPAALMFAPGSGGPLHRRVLDIYGQPVRQFGYFLLSVTPLK